ncbi:MAG: hypothetical protein V3W04_09770 [Gammaproteobacteria bacterium]
MTRETETLQALVSKSVEIVNPLTLQTLLDHLVNKHKASIQAVIFYGSCLRSMDLYDGLADLYLIVDRYPHFYHSLLPAIANWTLPPNVYYLEIPGPDGKTLRAKYAVISEKDFKRATSKRWFHSYIWGRFTQPVALAYAKNDEARARVTESLSNAIVTFLTRTLPSIEESGTINDLWIQGMQLSYRAELRAETAQRASTLIESQPDYYASIAAAAAKQSDLKLSINGNHYSSVIHSSHRSLSKALWFVRTVQGKCLSLLRLIKALFTFNGGLDYIAWKLERHSGQTVHIPERVRHYPLIFVWGLLWKLYRRGVFR